MSTVEFGTTGPLFFPVTPFAVDGSFNPVLHERLVADGVAAGASAVFAACGTGEFHALSHREHGEVLRVTTTVVGSAVPVFAGVGGALGAVKEQVVNAERAGVHGLLLMPPYLVGGPQDGLLAYVREIAASTELPIVVYSRDNGVFAPTSLPSLTAIPNVIGYKDGVGDLESIGWAARIAQSSASELGRDFWFFNGMPAAETTMNAYAGVGVDLYSSSAFSFAPEISIAFYRAFTAGDATTVQGLLDTFYFPLAEVRSRVPGYAVALVKAGLRMRGTEPGSVRPPLVDPHPQDLLDMRRILEAGLDAVGAGDRELSVAAGT